MHCSWDWNSGDQEMELSWQLIHACRNPLSQVVRGVKSIAAFKVKVTDSLISLQPVLKKQLKVEEKEIMIQAINEPPSLPWKYKVKLTRCRSCTFILPMNLMKCLWYCEIWKVSVLRNAAGYSTVFRECKFSLIVFQCFKVGSWFKCYYCI